MFCHNPFFVAPGRDHAPRSYLAASRAGQEFIVDMISQTQLNESELKKTNGLKCIVCALYDKNTTIPPLMPFFLVRRQFLAAWYFVAILNLK